MPRAASKVGGRRPGRLPELALELHIRIALFAGWHDSVTFWYALPRDVSSPPTYLKLVQALIGLKGDHDEAILAELSILKEARAYKPLLAAYAELHPEVVKRAMAHSFAPERILSSILKEDHLPLLSHILDTHRQLLVDASGLLQCVERRARRCAEVLLRESLPSGDGRTPPRVKIEFPRWHIAAQAGDDSVDFRQYPQRLLWAAAQTRDAVMCDLMLRFLRERCGSAAKGNTSAADRLQRWAACCAVGCGHKPLLAACGGEEALHGALARVSFRAPSREGLVEFDDAPLAVVAAAEGHPAVLEELFILGADMHLCTRRGLTAPVAASHPRHPRELRERLRKVLREVGAGGRPSTPGAGSGLGAVRALRESGGSRPSTPVGFLPPLVLGRPRASGSSRPGTPAGAASRSSGRGVASEYTEDPLAAAVEAGDVRLVKNLISQGALLEGTDIMCAVKSGDLDMLEYVRGECKAKDQGEFRRAMRQTARQIVEANRHRLRASVVDGSGSEALRRAGGSTGLAPVAGRKPLDEHRAPAPF